MDAFWLCFELGKPLMGFAGAPQPHRAPHHPTVFHRPIFVNQLLDARKAFRPLRPIDHHHAPSLPRTPTDVLFPIAQCRLRDCAHSCVVPRSAAALRLRED
jgi:hypothetical protein